MLLQFRERLGRRLANLLLQLCKRSRDRITRRRGRRPPVATRRDRFTHVKVRDERAAAQHHVERRAQRQFARIGRRDRLPPLRILVHQADRLHRAAGRHRGLEQVRVERQQFLPVGRRPFRKHAHQPAVAQALGHLVHDTHRLGTLLALQEHGIELLGEPADHRPLPHLGFRHERRRPPRVDRVDVEPRHVIADHERARVEPRAVVMDDETHPADPQQLERPAAYQLGAARGRDVRKTQRDDRHAAQQVKDETQLPNGNHGEGPAWFSGARTRPARPRASRARWPAVRSRGTASCGPGSSAPAARHASVHAGRTRTGRPRRLR